MSPARPAPERQETLLDAVARVLGFVTFGPGIVIYTNQGDAWHSALRMLRKAAQREWAQRAARKPRGKGRRGK